MNNSKQQGYSLARDKTLEQKTGIKFLTPDGGRDEEAYDKAIQKSAEMAQQQLTPAAIRTSNAIIDAMEVETGTKLSESDRAKTLQVLVTFGNRAPTLDSDTRSKLNVAEYGLGATQQLIDEIEKHPEVKFGPGVFKFDEALGKWVGGNPEAAKIAQLYSQLYAGQAFAQGGKALTGIEIQMIRNQIGNPNNTNFREALKTAQSKYVQDLGLYTRQLRDRKFDAFPAYKDWISRLIEQRADAIEKYGVETSSGFAAPLGAATNKVGKYRILEVK